VGLFPRIAIQLLVNVSCYSTLRNAVFCVLSSIAVVIFSQRNAYTSNIYSSLALVATTWNCCIGLSSSSFLVRR